METGIGYKNLSRDSMDFDNPDGLPLQQNIADYEQPCEVWHYRIAKADPQTSVRIWCMSP